MSAVQMVYIGNDIKDLKTLEFQESSYDPRASIIDFSKEAFTTNTALRDIAVVCTFNNKA